MLEVEVTLELSLLAAESQRLGNVERVVVAGADRHVGDPEAAATDVLDGEPVEALDVRDADGLDGHDQDPLVEHVAVLDVRSQGQGCRVAAGVQEHRDARYSYERWLDRRQRVEEFTQRPLLSPAVAGDDHLAPPPCDHHGRRDQSDHEREPRSVGDLRDVRTEEGHLHREEQRAERDELAPRGAPQQPCDGNEQQRV